MSILDKILQHKTEEVAEKKSLYPVKLLERSIYFPTTCVSLTEYLKREDLHGIIAEFKRQSPSKGAINVYANIEEISIGYMQGGASALSVLTDEHFFGGSSKDLTTARTYNYCPILRKDFIVDEYQIIEAKSIGADAILLIAAALKPEQCTQLAEFAKNLGLEVLLEVHNDEEARNYPNQFVDVVGVNNRDLKSFEVSLDTSHKLSQIIPADFVKISESGINTVKDIVELRQSGFEGFLMGERFMREANPAQACSQFIDQLPKRSKSLVDEHS